MKLIFFVAEAEADRRAVILIARRILKEKKFIGKICVASEKECFHMPSGKFHKKEDLLKVINILRSKIECMKQKNFYTGWDFKVIFIRDSDGECPKTYGELFRDLIKDLSCEGPVSFVMSKKEIESWFLANTDKFKDKEDIDTISNPKDKYLDETEDRIEFRNIEEQVERINVQLTESKSRSFRKFVKEITS